MNCPSTHDFLPVRRVASRISLGCKTALCISSRIAIIDKQSYSTSFLMDASLRLSLRIPSFTSTYIQSRAYLDHGIESCLVNTSRRPEHMVLESIRSFDSALTVTTHTSDDDVVHILGIR